MHIQFHMPDAEYAQLPDPVTGQETMATAALIAPEQKLDLSAHRVHVWALRTNNAHHVHDPVQQGE